MLEALAAYSSSPWVGRNAFAQRDSNVQLFPSPKMTSKEIEFSPPPKHVQRRSPQNPHASQQHASNAQELRRQKYLDRVRHVSEEYRWAQRSDQVVLLQIFDRRDLILQMCRFSVNSMWIKEDHGSWKKHFLLLMITAFGMKITRKTITVTHLILVSLLDPTQFVLSHIFLLYADSGAVADDALRQEREALESLIFWAETSSSEERNQFGNDTADNEDEELDQLLTNLMACDPSDKNASLCEGCSSQDMDISAG
ncbi:uncharacterized protein KY384_006928 [Bacidia gigantensis]|uniref:uncharacterized protein n=1 Tax=Bacidia gigantensis TaxID=2732470 RepID=UPI001D04B452|nr:uncharacterized protein KY384_006928 [Bacidia gigantensis]KAG8528012.1 hypothetical protein KY384_006928 [Bacidia gigantensis]